MSESFWLSDEQFGRLAPLLPTDTRGVPRVDDRRVISGIIHVLQSGCRWKDAPAEYGPHKTLYNRFVRWARKGVWQGVFVRLADSGGPPAAVMLDSTHVKAHRSAAGGKGGRDPGDRPLAGRAHDQDPCRRRRARPGATADRRAGHRSDAPVAVFLRPGKTPSGGEVRAVLKHLVRRIRRHWPPTRIVFRGDSHYARLEATTRGFDARFIVTSLSGEARRLCEESCCARGQAENPIKLHKTQLASERTSCQSPTANQVRPVLHTCASWMMLVLRNAIPQATPLARAEFATLRLRLLKIGARVVEKAARIRIHFTSACPNAALFRMLAGRLATAGPCIPGTRVPSNPTIFHPKRLPQKMPYRCPGASGTRSRHDNIRQNHPRYK